MACSTVTSALICRVTSALRERGGKTESTLCSLVKLVKGKSDYPACLAESQDLEGPGQQTCSQTCGLWPLSAGYYSVVEHHPSPILWQFNVDSQDCPCQHSDINQHRWTPFHYHAKIIRCQM